MVTRVEIFYDFSEFVQLNPVFHADIKSEISLPPQ